MLSARPSNNKCGGLGLGPVGLAVQMVPVTRSDIMVMGLRRRTWDFSVSLGLETNIQEAHN